MIEKVLRLLSIALSVEDGRGSQLDPATTVGMNRSHINVILEKYAISIEPMGLGSR